MPSLSRRLTRATPPAVAPPAPASAQSSPTAEASVPDTDEMTDDDLLDYLSMLRPDSPDQTTAQTLEQLNRAAVLRSESLKTRELHLPSTCHDKHLPHSPHTLLSESTGAKAPASRRVTFLEHPPAAPSPSSAVKHPPVPRIQPRAARANAMPSSVTAVPAVPAAAVRQMSSETVEVLDRMTEVHSMTEEELLQYVDSIGREHGTAEDAGSGRAAANKNRSHQHDAARIRRRATAKLAYDLFQADELAKLERTEAEDLRLLRKEESATDAEAIIESIVKEAWVCGGQYQRAWYEEKARWELEKRAAKAQG